MITFKLASKAILSEKARAATAVLGIAAATALLAWHLILAETVSSQAKTSVTKATAPFSAWISGPAPRGRPAPLFQGSAPEEDNKERATAEATTGFRRMARTAGPLPEELVARLRSSDKIKAEFLSVHHVQLDVRPGGRVLQGPPLMGGIAAMPDTGKPPLSAQHLKEEIRAEVTLDGNKAIFNETLFYDRMLPLPEVGEKIPVLLREGTVILEVAGFFKSDTIVKAFPSIYTTSMVMENIFELSPNATSYFNLALCETVKGGTVKDVEQVLESVPEADDCIYYTRDAVQDRYKTDTASNISKQLPLSLSLAFVTAICMLLTMLTTGIAGQRKTLALLRCNGLTRGGTALVFVWETLLISIIGWAIGLLTATLLVQLFLISDTQGELPTIVRLGWKAPAGTALLTLLSGSLAAIMPCIQSAKVRPLEIVEGDVSEPRPVSVSKTIYGLLLMLPMPFFALLKGVDTDTRSILLIAVALPYKRQGSALCLHALTRAVEVIFSRLISKILAIDPSILSRRISRAPGRAMGAVLTLAFGLGTFMAIHIWGGTLMSSYVPSPEWPDVIVSVLPTGIDKEAFDSVENTGVAGNGPIPIEASQFTLSEETLKEIESRGLPRPSSDLILVFGVDPEKAFGGENPLANFKFTESDRKTATARMLNSDSCIVPEMFTRLTGLHVGDKFILGGKELEICGVIDLNWHLVTSRARVRSLSGKLNRGTSAGGMFKPTQSMVFTSESCARLLTENQETIYFFWLNLSPELQALHPLQASIRLDASLNSAIDASYADRRIENMDKANSLQVHHRDEIADGTIAHGYNILGTLARIPFWSLAVTASGIAAMLVASAHASRRELNTMHAVGMTRRQLASMFIGEGMFAIICAIILSFAAGIVIGWSFTSITIERMSAGLARKLYIPWGKIAEGVLFLIITTCIMMFLPMRRIIRRI